MLKCPELELKLVTTATGDAEYRAKIAAKFLALAGCAVPVGIGVSSNDEVKSQAEWVNGYDLGAYPGKVHRDGVAAMIDLIIQSPAKMKVICIGPLTNLAEALCRCPEIAHKTELICMLGSIHKGVSGADGGIAEYNVVQDIPAAQAVFSGQWPIRMTPLDTCGIVRLQEGRYQKVHTSEKIIPKMIMENYAIWDRRYQFNTFERESSILFDTVAVHMAYSDSYLDMQSMEIRISDDGFMHQGPAAKRIDCAIDWRDKDGFEQLLTERLTG